MCLCMYQRTVLQYALVVVNSSAGIVLLHTLQCVADGFDHLCAGLFTDHRPDADKNEEELRLELMQLRDVWRIDQNELKKLHKVC